MPDQASKARAAEVARALMRSENISASAAAQRIASDFGMSAETIRRAALDIVYAKEANGNLHVRVERLERLVAEMQQMLESHPKKGGRPRTLTPEQVRDIRQEFRDDPRATQTQLARKYGVSQAAVRGILLGALYADVHPELIVTDVNRGKKSLTVETVRELRRRYRDREASGPDLCAEYGVSQSQFYQILDGKAWKGALLPGEEPRIARHRLPSQ